MATDDPNENAFVTAFQRRVKSQRGLFKFLIVVWLIVSAGSVGLWAFGFKNLPEEMRICKQQRSGLLGVASLVLAASYWTWLRERNSLEKWMSDVPGKE